MPCEIIQSPNVGGNCPLCHKDMAGGLHFHGDTVSCSECCAEHKPREFKEWSGTPAEVKAEQEDLFPEASL